MFRDFASDGRSSVKADSSSRRDYVPHTTGHILKSYDADLAELKHMVLHMGSGVLRAIDQAFYGLLEADRGKCIEVVQQDQLIDLQEKKIDERGMSILMRFNPVASDLRVVLSSMNICRSLERIGDHAVDLARSSQKMLTASEIEEVRLIDPLYLESHKAVSMALTSYADIDESAALKVVKMERQIDHIHQSLSAQIVKGVCHTDALLNLLFISRSLERIGDLAINIAEDVVFISSAQDIRHT